MCEVRLAGENRVQGAAVAVDDGGVRGAQIFPDAYVSRGRVDDSVGEARGVDVARVFELGDEVDLGDRVERAVGGGRTDADLLGLEWARPLSRCLEACIFERVFACDNQVFREPVKVAQALLTQVRGGVEAAALSGDGVRMVAGFPSGRVVSGERRRGAFEGAPLGVVRVSEGVAKTREAECEGRDDADAGDRERLHAGGL